MFGGDEKFKMPKMSSIIGPDTKITGNINFSGGLQVDGEIKGNIVAADKEETVLNLNEHGHIEGEIHVANIILNGTVTGDVHASSRIELGSKAKINGNVHYDLLEMTMGAEVNGNLLHTNKDAPLLGYDQTAEDELPKSKKTTSSSSTDEIKENLT